jgi:predicted ArsR family transcriptional regulator
VNYMDTNSGIFARKHNYFNDLKWFQVGSPASGAGRPCRLKRDTEDGIEQFTERSRGFIQAAATEAMREGHQQIAPEHLLKALLDDAEGAAAGIVRAAGGPARVLAG